eukprot:PhM_4_TR8806/c0_g1_i1/m.83656/K17914/KIF13; kinesin family member 13
MTTTATTPEKQQHVSSPRVQGKMRVLANLLQQQQQSGSPTTTVHSPRRARRSGTSNTVLKSESSNFQVLIRTRPFLPSEFPTDASALPLMEPEGDNKVVLLDRNMSPRETFLFNKVFWHMDSTDASRDQEEVFDMCGEPVVASAWGGYNGSILAYGQTSSGKTHTMMGTEQHPGIIPRLCRRLFEAHSATTTPSSAVRTNSPSILNLNNNMMKNNMIGDASSSAIQPSGLHEVRFEVSFMEIYNEHVLDLLDPSSNVRLRVRNHPVTGPFVDGLRKARVETWQQALLFIKKGNEGRHVGATKMNEQSSRSHAIFQIHLTQSTATVLGTSLVRSTVHLVDLAGSERVKQSAVEGERFRETREINQSLSTLRRVIDALVSTKGGTPSAFIPYRESTLTWLLSETFGGNARSFLIGTLCPHANYVDETYNTLQYVHRAKDIKNIVVKNEDNIARLIRELEESIVSGAAAGVQDEEEAALKKAVVLQLQEQKDDLESKYEKMQEELESAKRMIERHTEQKREDREAREELARRMKQAERVLSDERQYNFDRVVRMKRKLDEIKAELASSRLRQQEVEDENAALRAELQALRSSEASALRIHKFLVPHIIAVSCKQVADLDQFEEGLRERQALYEAHVSDVVGAQARIVHSLEHNVARLRLEVDGLNNERRAARDGANEELVDLRRRVDAFHEQIATRDKELQRAHSAIADVCGLYLRVRDYLSDGPHRVGQSGLEVIETLRSFCGTWGRHRSVYDSNPKDKATPRQSSTSLSPVIRGPGPADAQLVPSSDCDVPFAATLRAHRRRSPTKQKPFR